MQPKLFAAASLAALAMAGSAAAEGAAAPSPTAPTAAPPAPYAVSFSVGADYSSGKYGGTEATKIWIAPISATVKADSWRFSATIPYLRISGPGGVVIGPDGRPLPGVPGASGKRDGFGDLSLAATYSLPTDALGGFLVDLTGRVKLPTSEKSKHLGTGKTDYTVSTDISYPIGDWAPFVDVGYRMPGSPSGVDLKNSVTASVGTSYVMDKTVLIASYDYAEKSSPFAKDSHEVFGAVSSPLTSHLNWTLYGIAGLSDGAPDYEAGLLLTYKLR